MKIKICGITNLDDALAAIQAGADMLGFNFYPKSPRYVTPEQCAVITKYVLRSTYSVMLVGVFVNSPVDQVAAILDQCGLNLAQLSGDEPVEVLSALGEQAFKAVRLSTDSSTDSETDKWMETDVAPAVLLEYGEARQGGTPALDPKADKRIETDSSTDAETDKRMEADSSTDAETDKRMEADSSTDSKADKRMEADVTPAAIAEYVKARQGRSPALLVDAAVKGAYGGTGMTTNWSAAAILARQVPLLLAGGLTPDNVAAAVRQVRPWGVDVASGVEASPGKKDPHKVRAFIQNARAALRDGGAPIEPASKDDLPEILTLQKLAYQSEAGLNNDFNIPPLTQTLPEIEEEFARRTFLKAVTNGRLVGSVRAHLQDGTCHIGRLIVHPDWQNQGIGGRLMKEIEERFVRVERFELFTGERSARNIHLYQKLGYQIFRQERLSERVTLVYMEKRNGSAA